MFEDDYAESSDPVPTWGSPPEGMPEPSVELEQHIARDLVIEDNQPERLVVPATTSFQEWYGYRARLLAMVELERQLDIRKSLHAIDWLMQGQELFGHEAEQGQAFLENVFGWKKPTFDIYRDVATRWPPEKRLPDISMAHYRLVKALPPKTAQALLETASESRWTTRELKVAIEHQVGAPEKTSKVSKQEIVDAARNLIRDLKPRYESYDASPLYVERLAELVGMGETLVPLEIPGQEALDLDE